MGTFCVDFSEEGVIAIIGQRLRELRLDRNKTQKETADDLGITRTRYAGFEQGLSEPNLEILNKLAVYFAVSVDYLLGRGERTMDEELGELLQDPDDALFLEVYKNATPEQRRKVREFLMYVKRGRTNGPV